MTTQRTPHRPPATIDGRWCAVHNHVIGTPPVLVINGDNTPCDIHPRAAALMEELATISLDEPVSAPPSPAGRYGQVLAGIRAVLVLVAFLLAVIVMLLAALAHSVLSVPASPVPVHGAVGVVLMVPSERDSAAETLGHLIMADGSEHDVTTGAWSGDVVGARLQVTAGPDGLGTGCRILVDNVRVAEEVAQPGETATCIWDAP